MKSLALSFVYAWRGIVYCVRHERNFRIHLCCMAYMYSYLLIYDFFDLSRRDFAVLFLANAAVLAAELINTAVERVVDMTTKDFNKYAKAAKDCAAGAVLIFAIFAVAVGIALLWQPEAFRQLFDYYVTHPLMIVALIISLILCGFFIFAPYKKK